VKENQDRVLKAIAELSDEDLRCTLSELQSNLAYLESGQSKIIILSFYRKIKLAIELCEAALLSRISHGRTLSPEENKPPLFDLPGGQEGRRPRSARQTGRLSLVRRRRRK
jgi:hypothetical protein